MKKAAFVTGFLAVFIAGFWLIAVPVGLITDFLENSVGREDFYIETEGLNKGLFYNIMAEGVTLKKTTGDKDPGTALLILNNVNAGLNITSLLKLSPEVDFDCDINGGRVIGSVKLTEKGTVIINGSGIRVAGIPLFDQAGIKGDGDISLNVRLDKGAGEVRFSVDNMKLKNTSLGGVLLPLGLFNDIRGSIVVKGKTAELKSLALEGDGVYARVKGVISGDKLDLNMELMMDSTFENGYVYRAMLAKYMSSPGHYVIPVKMNYSRF